ncbi:heme exporter protein CcmD [Sphingomonas crocodyli]|uniref:Heme exporter protein D n=1 Tax=Sphingomonas crocodyli TaxID=1979270 RepID=A0A437M8W6_9SPHN|nr:heme exporter protein CcmD [Sphingomonas crocodyli]RVT94161.1 heme exporter protein CcmD [Sphingomonas crocodyli]
MNHWPFITAAYAITIVGTIAIIAISYAAMRRAEKKADALTKRDRP